jgi:CelD/BcsL family acetyltransferase involved in cellulose biosynthesis
MLVAKAATASCATNERPEIVDPTQYPGWDDLVAVHPQGAFFHTACWARVLAQTYGHRPVYVCRLGDGRIRELLPIMEVASVLTGRRGVSLPFTDYCPLISLGKGCAELLNAAVEEGRRRDWRSLELRGHVDSWSDEAPSLVFHGHIVELAHGRDYLFRHLNEGMRRGIRKARKAGLNVEFSRRGEAVREFYELHCKTRKRHGLPPQPIRFFDNIGRCVIERGLGTVAIARQARKVIAGAVFFHFNTEVIYKFGASDHRFQALRPNNLLMWEAIQHYAEAGFSRLHLGRTSPTREGLRRFKLGLGGREETLEYRTYDFRKAAFVNRIDRSESWMNHVFRCLPQPVLRLAGEWLYPHLS